MKKTGPKKRFLSVEEREEEILSRVDPGVRGKLKELVDEFKDVFPDTLPKGRSPKGTLFTKFAPKRAQNPLVGHLTNLGQLSKTRWRSRLKTSLLRVSSGPKRVPTARLSCLSPKRMAGGVCALITGPSTNRLCKTNSHWLALMHYLRDWARPRCSQSWTSHLDITRSRWKRHRFRKQLSNKPRPF